LGAGVGEGKRADQLGRGWRELGGGGVGNVVSGEDEKKIGDWLDLRDNSLDGGVWGLVL